MAKNRLIINILTSVLLGFLCSSVSAQRQVESWSGGLFLVDSGKGFETVRFKKRLIPGDKVMVMGSDVFIRLREGCEEVLNSNTVYTVLSVDECKIYSQLRRVGPRFAAAIGASIFKKVKPKILPKEEIDTSKSQDLPEEGLKAEGMDSSMKTPPVESIAVKKKPVSPLGKSDIKQIPKEAIAIGSVVAGALAIIASGGTSSTTHH